MVVSCDELALHVRDLLARRMVNASEWFNDDEISASAKALGLLTTRELLAREGWTLAQGDVFDALAQSIGAHLWCSDRPFHHDVYQRAMFFWTHTEDHFTHRMRYFMFDDPLHERYAETAMWYPTPRGAFEELGDAVEASGALTVLRRGTKLFRVRRLERGRRLDRPEDYDAPPRDVVQVNRMNAPGVQAVYVSTDPETALAETVQRPGLYSVATFALQRDIRIVQLVDLPSPPSLLDEDWSCDPERLAFLRDIAADISKPVARTDRVQLDYLRTQVIGEYFCRGFRPRSGPRPEAVMWASARAGGRSLVLYGGPELRTGVDAHSWHRTGHDDDIVPPTLDLIGTPRVTYRAGHGMRGELDTVRKSVREVGSALWEAVQATAVDRTRDITRR